MIYHASLSLMARCEWPTVVERERLRVAFDVVIIEAFIELVAYRRSRPLWLMITFSLISSRYDGGFRAHFHFTRLMRDCFGGQL